MRKLAWASVLVVVFGVALLTPRIVHSHCDTMDGPVVTAARTALEKGDVAGVLKWVKKEHEGEVRAAFQKALAVRGKGPEAKDLADMYFFETLVRVHRAGEGEPYTGLKATGVEPVVVAADKALESGSVEALAKEVADAAARGIRERFARAVEKKKHADETVEAGREYVRAYVEFVHYVERLHQDAAGAAAHHDGAEGHAAEHGHEH